MMLKTLLAFLIAQGTITNNQPFGGSYEPFLLTVSLSKDFEDPGLPVGNMMMPSLTVAASSDSEFTVSVNMTILNTDNFVAFAKALLFNSNYTLHLTGTATLTADKFSFSGIDFDKYLIMTGMDGLKNVTINNVDFSNSSNQAIELNVQTTMYNPSQVSINLGDLKFDGYYLENNNDALIGKVRVDSFTIKPGSNTFPLYGTLDTSNIQNLDPMLNNYLAGDVMVVTAKIAPGGITSPLFYEAMQDWAIVAPIPGLIGGLIKDIMFLALTISPLSDTEIFLSVSANLTITNPLGSNVTVDVQFVGLDMSITDPSGNPLVTTPIPSTAVSGNALDAQGNPTIALTVSLVLEFTDQDVTANFIKFVYGFTTQEIVELLVVGSASVQLSLGPLESLQLRNIPCNNAVTIPGMNSLSDNSVTAASFDGSTQEYISLNLTLTVVNPSIVTVVVGDLTFDMYYEGSLIGNMTATNVTFFPSTNTIFLQGFVDPLINTNATVAAIASQAAVDLFLNYINGPGVTCQATAGPNAISNVIMNQGFQGISITTHLVGLNGIPVVQVTNMQLPQNVEPLSTGVYAGINITVDAVLNNTSIAYMKLGSIQFETYYYGSYQGTIHVNQLNLVPGVNIFSSSGVLNPNATSLAATGQFFTNYVAGLNCPVTLQASVINVAKAAPWFQKTVSSLALFGALHTNNYAPLNLISGISMIGQITASLPDTGNPSMGGTAQTTFVNPFAFQIIAQSASMNISVYNGQDVLVGTMAIPWSTVTTVSGTTILDIAISGSLVISNKAAFEQFIQTMLQTTGTTMILKGVASVKIQTGAGVIQVNGVPASATVPITGFNSFQGQYGKLTIGGISIVPGSSTTTLNVNIATTITSYSNMDVTLGSAYFNVEYVYNGAWVVVAQASASGVVINGNPSGGVANTFTFAGTFTESSSTVTAAISSLLSNYIDLTGNSQAVTLLLTGTPETNPTALQQALMATTIYPVYLAGVSKAIVNSVGITGTSSGVMYINNPTNVQITVTVGAINCYVCPSFHSNSPSRMERLKGLFSSSFFLSVVSNSAALARLAILLAIHPANLFSLSLTVEVMLEPLALVLPMLSQTRSVLMTALPPMELSPTWSGITSGAGDFMFMLTAPSRSPLEVSPSPSPTLPAIFGPLSSGDCHRMPAKKTFSSSSSSSSSSCFFLSS